MSPFIAIAAAILTFMAFWVQHNANNEMLKNNDKQNVEKQFYEMLQIHKQNVKELLWENWTIKSSAADNILNINTKKNKNLYSFHQTTGYNVFKLHWIEYSYIEDSLLEAINHFNQNATNNINYNNIESWKKIVAFSYNIYMHGMNHITKFYDISSQKSFFKLIHDNPPKIAPNKHFATTFPKLPKLKEKPLFKEDVNNLIPLHVYVKLSSFKKNMQPHQINLYYTVPYDLLTGAKYFSGHFDELNRYYRHLYQTVKIIANYDSKIISYDEKRKFLRMLRAQLTNKEQILLFYNWLSGPIYGEDWEKTNENHFFTEYRMIHNISPQDSQFFKKQNTAEIIQWIKNFNPNYNDYDEHPLFEFENYQKYSA